MAHIDLPVPGGTASESCGMRTRGSVAVCVPRDGRPITAPGRARPWTQLVSARSCVHESRRHPGRGEFDSRGDLVHRMLDFIEHGNTKAAPFKWVYNRRACRMTHTFNQLLRGNTSRW